MGVTIPSLALQGGGTCLLLLRAVRDVVYEIITCVICQSVEQVQRSVCFAEGCKGCILPEVLGVGKPDCFFISVELLQELHGRRYVFLDRHVELNWRGDTENHTDVHAVSVVVPRR